MEKDYEALNLLFAMKAEKFWNSLGKYRVSKNLTSEEIAALHQNVARDWQSLQNFFVSIDLLEK